MFELLAKAVIVLLLLVTIVYLVTKFIPRFLLTWLGGLVVAAALVLVFLQPGSRLISELVRIVSFPLTPLGLALLLLSVFLIKGGGKMLWFPLVLLWIFSTPLAAQQLAKVVEQQAITLAGIEGTARPIVLLGRGTTRPNLRPTLPDDFRVQLSNTGELLYYAARLYNLESGVANRPDPVMIVSAGPRPELKKDKDAPEEHIEANDIRKVLVNLGVPEQNILLEPKGTSIRKSAEEVEELLEKEQLGQRMILVSSALNIDRAVKTFQRLSNRSGKRIEIVPRPTDFYTAIPYKDKDGNEKKRKFRRDPEERIPDLLPDARALSVTTRILQELLLTIYYFIMDWISLSGY